MSWKQKADRDYGAHYLTQARQTLESAPEPARALEEYRRAVERGYKGSMKEYFRNG